MNALEPMNDVWVLAGAFAAGAVLGLLYFLGLWLTVRQIVRRRLAPLWLPLSLMVRLGLLVGGMYWVGAGDWQRFVAALAGIFVARLLTTRYRGTALQAGAAASAAQEGRP